ncbi:MAG: site-2 protease family protein [Methanobrevibacter sp.]|nr:site-2 protease family protein [Methanobrevibacter sp.]
MFKFTSNEIRDLIISFFVISIAFAILYSGRDFSIIPEILPMVMVGVGSGFILHEVAHKITAMHYGYWAEFKTWIPGLFIALISPFFGFIFAAPGAVYIYGDYMSDKENGIISLFGPLTNIVLAMIFLLLYLFTMTSSSFGVIQDPWTMRVLITTFILGFSINSFLALFNLIPFSVLDGAKIFRWNPLIWLGAAALAGIMVFFSFTGIPFY